MEYLLLSFNVFVYLFVILYFLNSVSAYQLLISKYSVYVKIYHGVSGTEFDKRCPADLGCIGSVNNCGSTGKTSEGIMRLTFVDLIVIIR